MAPVQHTADNDLRYAQHIRGQRGLDTGDQLLHSGDKIFVDVGGFTLAGLNEPHARARSQAVTIDLSPPRAGAVIDALACADGDIDCVDGREADIAVSAPSSSVGAWWRDFLDMHSGIQYYSLCAGTQPGLCDLAPLTRRAVRTHRSTAQVTAGASPLGVPSRTGRRSVSPCRPPTTSVSHPRSCRATAPRATQRRHSRAGST